MKTTEIWNEISGFPDYQVSNLGRVRSFKRDKINGTILMSGCDMFGYLHIGLRGTNGKITKKIHRLVALAFLPNPNNYPVINHIDGIKSNNNLDNLEWCTHKENTRHAVKIGLIPSGKESPLSRLYVLMHGNETLSYYTSITKLIQSLQLCYKTLYLYRHMGTKLYDVLDIHEVYSIPDNAIVDRSFDFNKSTNMQLRKPIGLFRNNMPISYYKGAKQLANIVKCSMSGIAYMVEHDIKLLDKYTVKYITKFEYLIREDIQKDKDIINEPSTTIPVGSRAQANGVRNRRSLNTVSE